MCFVILQIATQMWRIGLLRYFHPVGAHSIGLIGKNPVREPNNLMPYISQVASGRRSCLRIFGFDYSTPDGTGMRDYICLVDLGRVIFGRARSCVPAPANTNV